MTTTVDTVDYTDTPYSDEMRDYTSKAIADGCFFWVWSDSTIIIPIHRIKKVVVATMTPTTAPAWTERNTGG